MSTRELVVLGTASQVPTRYRNHNGYFLRWDGEGVLFDPGEGTQRQMTMAGVAASDVTRICVTHFHGDHCLGLAGVIQRLSLERIGHEVDVYFPVGGKDYFDRLRRVAIYQEAANLRVHPVEGGTVAEPPPFKLVSRWLDHRVEALGWRVEEPTGRRMLPERLEPLGIRGPDVGKLQRDGLLEVDGRTVVLEEVSMVRRGQRFAFVMDTRPCDGALALAEGADLLVCEATFLEEDATLAREYGHLTAAQAARLAKEAGARRLVLTHFSQRYPDENLFLAEAEKIFPDVVVARDLVRIPLPSRRGR